jgi:hypothetical protein
MIQGTTPTHTFSLPFTANNVRDVMIAYVQNREVIFRKETKDCVFTDNKIQVDLTQEDTFSLSHLSLVTIEFMALTSNNKVVGRKFNDIKVEETVNKAVFTI